jgi:hypothetical protein
MEKDFSVIRMIIFTTIIVFFFDIIWLLASLPKIGFLIAWCAYYLVNIAYIMYKLWKDANPKPKMTMEIQIMVLKYAIDNYDDLKYFYGHGLCYRISDAIKEFTDDEYNYYSIRKYIPSFTRKNCTRLAKIYGFEKPHPTDSYWWDYYNKEVRLACLKALLNELEKDLVN